MGESVDLPLRHRLEVAAAAPPASQPNLLTFPEAFDNAAWVKTSAAVTANVGDATHPTADRIACSAASGDIRQTSTTASTTGAAANKSFPMTPSWARYSVTGTFDGVDYTFSVELLDPGSNDLLLQINRSGGFLQVVMNDASSGDPTFLAYGAKLERAPSFTGYP